MWELDYKESWVLQNWCFWTVVLEKTPEIPLDCKEIKPVHRKGNQSWVFIGRTDVETQTPSTLATWCEELTHWKRPWCWERLRAGGEGDNRGWDGWMASPTQWTWVWVDSGSWWWARRPAVHGSQSRTWLSDWTELNCLCCYMGFSLVVAGGGCLLVVVHRILIAVASRSGAQVCGVQVSGVAAPTLWSTDSVVVAHGLSCSTAFGISLDQGSNPCLLHWPEDSLPLDYHVIPWGWTFLKQTER